MVLLWLVKIVAVISQRLWKLWLTTWYLEKVKFKRRAAVLLGRAFFLNSPQGVHCLVAGEDLLMSAFLPLSRDRPRQTTHYLFFFQREARDKMAAGLTLMYEHLIEGKSTLLILWIYTQANRQKSNRKWLKTKWIKWLSCINANSGERCQEWMGDEENAADFTLIC